jgi:hypothetical protein
MAVRLDETLAGERERIAPHAARLAAFVRRHDPDARFVLRVGHDPDFWELVAYVRPDVADDPDLGHDLAIEATDIDLDYDVPIVVLRLPRED